MFSFAVPKCAISPTVVSETNSENTKLWPPSSALTDHVNDGWISFEPEIFDFWMGASNVASSFVIDLGYEATVAEVHLRNAYFEYSGQVVMIFGNIILRLYRVETQKVAQEME